MSPGILGKKIGMTQLFRPDGQVVPVTLLKAGPCMVVQRKTPTTDGYDAVQLGLLRSEEDWNDAVVPAGRAGGAGDAAESRAVHGGAAQDADHRRLRRGATRPARVHQAEAHQ